MSALDRPELYRMDKKFAYRGDYTNEISFPLGGIGSGAIGLGGNGRLIDWEIFNRPNKNSTNGFSFFAIKAEHEGQVKVAKVLAGDVQPPYSGNGHGKFTGFGFGVDRETLGGLPHFERTTFSARFPFAEVQFEDDRVPLDVRLIAYNPFIPLNDKDSSLPVASFTYKVTNHFDHAVDLSLVANLTNPSRKGAINEFKSASASDSSSSDGNDPAGVRGIHLHSTELPSNSPEYGDLFLSTDGEDISYQNYWYRGGWFDNLTVFWKDFIAPGRFKQRNYDETRSNGGVSTYNRLDVCLLASHTTLQPGETKEFRFLITWNFPNFVNYWNPGECCTSASGAGVVGSEAGTVADNADNGSACPYPMWQKNYYATLFEDSVATAQYVWSNRQRLETETREFTDAIYASTLPDHVIDAIASNLAVLKSPTCVRLTDGTLYGFEGLHVQEGCCEGSCTHVWNYEQATAFLFPALARGMREIDYKATMFPNGKMAFRMMLPTDRDKSAFRAAADGQMGGIVKVYREWKVSGDTQWLRKIWPKVRKALAYAWEVTNEDGWDADRDGVMEGVQHHTLDVEIYGPNTYITSIYHAALRAAAEMATALGDIENASEYNRLYEQGRKWVDENLFNGEYFHQRIDLQDKRFPVDEELGEIKYQIGEGCHIDQVIGQWHAHVVGLGYIMDPEKVKSAVGAIYRHNFIRCMREYANACRIYSLNDEAGLLICTWPKGNSPKVPVPYADETMNGFEYQAACHMIYEGLIDEGLEVVKAIRDRYDGQRRNPWNEIECGSNYARSMASFGLLLALSGFEYDAVQGHIGFSPKVNQGDFRIFWSVDSGWGKFEHQSHRMELRVQRGKLRVQQLQLTDAKVVEVRLEDVSIPFSQSGRIIRFEGAIEVVASQSLVVSVEEA